MDEQVKMKPQESRKTRIVQMRGQFDSFHEPDSKRLRACVRRDSAQVTSVMPMRFNVVWEGLAPYAELPIELRDSRKGLGVRDLGR